MPTKPTSVPLWNTGGANNTTPSGGETASGWVANTPAVSSLMNYLQKLTGEWLDYLNAPVGTGSGAGLAATGGSSSGPGLSGTGGSSSGPGLSGTGGSPNGHGLLAQGTGVGAGVSATGGVSGTGVVGTGGSSSGTGVRGVGGGVSGPGVVGIGSGSGAVGVNGQAQDAAQGGLFTSVNGLGLQAESTGNVRAPLRLVPKANLPSNVDKGALHVSDTDGQLYVAGDAFSFYPQVSARSRRIDTSPSVGASSTAENVIDSVVLSSAAGLRQGSTIRLSGAGAFNLDNAGSATFRVGRVSGGVTGASIVFGSTGSGMVGFWRLDALMTVRALGVSGNVEIVGSVELMGGASDFRREFSVANLAPFDTTILQVFGVSIQYSASNAGNGANSRIFIAELL